MAKEGVIRYTRNSILEGLKASILMDLGRVTNLGKMGEDKAHVIMDKTSRRTHNHLLAHHQNIQHRQQKSHTYNVKHQ